MKDQEILPVYLALSTKQRDQLTKAVLEAALRYKCGTDWREIFRVSRHGCNGRMLKIFDRLYKMTNKQFEGVIDAICKQVDS